MDMSILISFKCVLLFLRKNHQVIYCIYLPMRVYHMCLLRFYLSLSLYVMLVAFTFVFATKVIYLFIFLFDYYHYYVYFTLLHKCASSQSYTDITLSLYTNQRKISILQSFLFPHRLLYNISLFPNTILHLGRPRKRGKALQLGHVNAPSSKPKNSIGN